MVLKELIEKLNTMASNSPECLDLDVHLVTETEKSQVELKMGGIAVPTSYIDGVGVPNRIVLFSLGFT